MKHTRHITAGAMTVAITALIIFFDRMTVGFFMTFLTVPLIIYGCFYGLRASLPVYIGCVLITFIVSGFLPQVILMAGYGLVGLVAIACNVRQCKPRIKYGLMLVSIMPLYAVMIAFFGDFFGVSVHTIREAVTGFMPSIQNMQFLDGAIWISVVMLAMMEIFIIKTVSETVYRLLKSRIGKTDNRIKP